MWSPHDVMRAPYDGALMMDKNENEIFHAIMRAPSCKALLMFDIFVYLFISFFLFII